MPYVLIDEARLKEFDPEGKLETLPDDTGDKMTRLESKANELLGEKKRLQVDFDEHKTEAKRKINDLHQSKGGTEDAEKLQSQLDDALSKLKGKDDQINEINNRIKEEKKTTEATKLAAELTRDTRRAQLLGEKIANRIDIDENGKIVVLDESGNPTVSSTQELSGLMRKEYDFLVDGNQSSGGGSQGGPGGAGQAKKFTDLSPAEMVQLRREDPAEYERQKAASN